jgi:hypothetical protein
LRVLPRHSSPLGLTETHFLPSPQQLEKYHLRRRWCLHLRAARSRVFRPEIRRLDLSLVQKWLYIKDESTGTHQYGLAPLDMSQEILRRKSWDAEATPEELVAIECLIARIKPL